MTNEQQHHPHRDPSLDILRGIGLLCIILAHVGPPSYVFQLRNFDVPLMVMVSGASYSLSRAQNEKYGRYLYSRFVRLVIPTWVFLTFFFGVVYITSSIVDRPFPFSINQMLSSFTLMSGIGYVWIIRVLLLVAIIAPLSKFILPSNRALLWLSMSTCYIAFEYAVHYFSWPSIHWLDNLFNEFIFYLVPYGLVMLIGVELHKYKIKSRLTGAVILLLIFCCMFIWLYISTGSFVPSQRYKYPPTLYYLSYAVGMSLLFSCLVEFINVGSLLVGRTLSWIGRKTMWTYLWHISILYLFSWLHFKLNFVLMFFYVTAAAVFIAIVQERALKIILSKISDRKTKKFLTAIFCG